jgi:hypothetical protein
MEDGRRRTEDGRRRTGIVRVSATEGVLHAPYSRTRNWFLSAGTRVAFYRVQSTQYTTYYKSCTSAHWLELYSVLRSATNCDYLQSCCLLLVACCLKPHCLLSLPLAAAPAPPTLPSLWLTRTACSCREDMS